MKPTREELLIILNELDAIIAAAFRTKMNSILRQEAEQRIERIRDWMSK